MSREIWAVRFVGWGLVCVGIYTLAMSWHLRDPSTGLWAPSGDIVGVELALGAALDTIGRVLSRLAASAVSSRS
jgi:hypothetical protein